MFGGMIRTLRPHQWVKNLFVFAPVVFAKELGTLEAGIRSLSAVLIFCLAAGAVYTLNDLVDVEKDRAHPIKKKRPIASGQVPVHVASAFAAFLFAISVVGAVFLGIPFTLTAVGYIVLNLAYSFWLKKLVFVDVLCIATGFLLRVQAGCFAVEVEPSAWLFGCTFLLALFMALGKRHKELRTQDSTKTRSVLKHYSARTLTILMYLMAVLTAAAYTAYTLAPHTIEFFGTYWLVATVPFVLFGLIRFTMLVNRKKGDESPTEAILKDPSFIINIVVWIGVVLWLIYFF